MRQRDSDKLDRERGERKGDKPYEKRLPDTNPSIKIWKRVRGLVIHLPLIYLLP